MTDSVVTFQPVIGGVDTHLDTHTAAVLSAQGALLSVEQFPADSAGYAALQAWMAGFGPIEKIGVEGTGAYGAGLTRALQATDIPVIEVDRPDRSVRRRAGKSDPLDAENAARAVLSGRATGSPKSRDGKVEALRNLHIARRSAVDERADILRRIRTMLVTAPDPIRSRFRTLTVTKLIAAAAALRPDPAAVAAGDVTAAVKHALRSLARRHQFLTGQIKELDAIITPLVTSINPALVDVHGVGPEVASQLLITVGDNPDRMTSEAAFAMLCGVAPLPASSGKTQRHRLNRGGDRQANSALWRIVITRIGTDPTTKAYVQRHLDDRHGKGEIIRSLKRYVAREIYPILTS